ncbi:Histone-lysine N-methyltransferase SETMAR [Anthophora retusa]
MQPSHFVISTDFFGEGTISKSYVERWFNKFKSGDTNLADEKGNGQSSNFDDQALLAAVEDDESLTTRMLPQDFNVDHSTIVRRFKKLGKVWKLAGRAPHELSNNSPIKPNVSEFSPICCNERSKLRS